MEKISWTDRVENEEILRRVKEGKNVLCEIKRRKAHWIRYVMRSKCKRTTLRSFVVYFLSSMACLVYPVAQFVEALRYELEGRGFESRWCNWNFSLTQSFRLHHCPGVDSAPNRSEYQEYFLEGKGGRCIGLTILPLSCADCLEIWEPQPPGTLWGCPGL